MVTNKLAFAVFALVVLFPIYFVAIFLYTVTDAGWTFDLCNQPKFKKKGGAAIISGGVSKSMLKKSRLNLDKIEKRK